MRSDGGQGRFLGNLLASKERPGGIPPGAPETYELISNDEFIEIFEMGKRGQPLPDTNIFGLLANFREPEIHIFGPHTHSRGPHTYFREPSTHFRELSTNFREPHTNFRELSTNIITPHTHIIAPNMNIRVPDQHFSVPAIHFRGRSTNFRAPIAYPEQPSGLRATPDMHH